MLKIVVLGCNSFAGSQFINFALRNGAQVVGINRSKEQSAIFLPYKNNTNKANYKFYSLDLNKHFSEICKVIDEFKPSVVVDFAGQGMVAESWQAPEQWYNTNVVAKSRLHHFLNQVDYLDKYIRISTPEVYGSQDALAQESTVYNPSTPYAVSHAAIDMNLNAYHKQYQFPVVFTRFSNFYGAGQQLYRIIPRAIIYGLTGETLQLHGGGVAVRAFINGYDVASAIWKSIQNGKIGDIYHFSTDRFISIKELVQLIHKQMGLDFENCTQVSEDRPGKDANYLMDDSKARNKLDWQPKISLETGIQQTIDWVTENLTEIKSLPLNYQHKA
jgi:dTDP-glucose 4,6-dehydratase